MDTRYLSPSRRSVLQLLAALPVAASVTSARAASEKIKTAYVSSVPIDQQWASRSHLALKAAAARGEIDYQWSESVPNPDMARTMRDWARKGSQFIMGDAFSDEKEARQVASEYPKVAFLFGSSIEATKPNFSVFDNYIQDASYLTGIVAGGMTKTGVIGLVGGYAIPEVNRLMNAFMAGARDVNPKVKFLVSFIASWFDPAKAKEAGLAQIDTGADILYAERTGVADAAKERGVLAIGNLVNMQEQFPNTVVVSALWHMEPTVDRALRKVREGNFTAENYGPYSTLKYGGATISPYGTFESKVPVHIKQLVKEREAAIKEGKFPVTVDNNMPKSSV